MTLKNGDEIQLLIASDDQEISVEEEISFIFVQLEDLTQTFKKENKSNESSDMNSVVQRVLDEGVGNGTPSASVLEESNITHS